MTAAYRSFARSLIPWYKKSARDLPWRRTRDPYKIWISEVMLQQTTVAAVTPYYERWVQKFPTVQAVAAAPQETVLKMWQGLGYYQRAKNIHKTARIITEQHSGIIPDDENFLRRLPGFGAYTTGAVLSIAFHQRKPIIDANVRRVVMRQMALSGKADSARDKCILEFLEATMPPKEISAFNQGLMELGALLCRGKMPLCLACPVRKTCKACREGRQEVIPEPKKSVVKDIEVAVAVIRNNGKFLIQQRPSSGLFGDLWEFPGGKIEAGETPQDAVRREVKEEVGVDIEVEKALAHVRHFYTQFRANLHVWLCQPVQPIGETERRKWVALKNLAWYPMPSGSARIVEKLLASAPRRKPGP